MTEKLYYESAYMRRFEAVVTECVPLSGKEKDFHFEAGTAGLDSGLYLIALDRTAFYPQGGGQPADTGVLRERDTKAANEIRVLDVQEKDGVIWHCCDRALPEGTAVKGEIDWDRRFDHMQQHSGEHIVSGMLCSKYRCDNVGFHMGRDAVTIDYNAEIDWDGLMEIEDAANRYIWENHAFEEYRPDSGELKTINYRSKKAIEKDVRITAFPGADVCACCGTHVANSAEVGLVKFISCQKFTKGTRLELLCGRRAFDFLKLNFDQNRLIARGMAAGLDKTFEVYQKQRDEIIGLKLRTAELEKSYFAALSEKYAGEDGVLLFEKDLSPDSLRRLCLAISSVSTGLCAVFCGSDEDGSDQPVPEYKYAVAREGAELTDFVRTMNMKLNGRGGGRGGFAQGLVRAKEKDIRDFFNILNRSE